MILGFWHYGLSVSDIKATARFLCEDLGLQMTVPVTEREGPAVEKVVGLPGARLLICCIGTPDNGIIELNQYLTPEGGGIDLKICNHGVAHLAFRVKNIEEQYDRMVKKGIHFNTPPVLVEGGPLKGGKVCYLRGPDGITLELVEPPGSIDR